MLVIYIFTLIIVCIDKNMGRPVLEVSHPAALSGQDQHATDVAKAAKQRIARWPPNNNTFNFPKMLNNGDFITISGELPKNPESIIVTLVAEEKEVFQLLADFVSNSIRVSFYKNEERNDTNLTERANDMFKNSTFSLNLSLLSSEEGKTYVDVKISHMPLCIEEIFHNIQDITHVILKGAIVDGIGFGFINNNMI